MSLILRYFVFWQEHTLDFESQVIPASWNLDKKENVSEHKVSKCRTFPEVASRLQEMECWALLQYSKVLPSLYKDEVAITAAAKVEGLLLSHVMSLSKTTL